MQWSTRLLRLPARRPTMGALLLTLVSTLLHAKSPAKPALSGAESGISGRWEIVRVVTRNDAWTPGTLRPDDPRELGQTVDVSPERLMFSHLSAQCKPLFEKNVATPLPFSRLFSGRDEPGRNDVIAGRIRGRLNGLPRDYDTESAGSTTSTATDSTGIRSVTLLRIQCEGTSAAQPMPWPGAQNWLAQPRGQVDTLLWSREPNSIAVLRRVSGKPVTDRESKAGCPQRTSANEQAICNSAYLQMLHGYLTSSDRFIRTVEAKLSSEERRAFTSMAQARDACDGNAECLRQQLLQQVHYLISVEDRYALLLR